MGGSLNWSFKERQFLARPFWVQLLAPEVAAWVRLRTCLFLVDLGRPDYSFLTLHSIYCSPDFRLALRLLGLDLRLDGLGFIASSDFVPPQRQLSCSSSDGNCFFLSVCLLDGGKDGRRSHVPPQQLLR